MAKYLVIIPTYNEKENVALIIEAIFNLPETFHILIVDDNSPDGTADIVKKLMSNYTDKLFMIQRSGKLGLGTAYLTGFKWAIENRYDFVIEMDADFSHNPNDLPRLLNNSKQKNCVTVGSRYVKGGALKNWPWDRIFYSKGASYYTRLLTRMPIKDPTAGFICYPIQVLKSIKLDNIRFVGYAFQIEMKFAAFSLGFLVDEIPITFVDRKLGASKMTKGIIQEGIKGVAILSKEKLLGKYAKKMDNRKS